MQFREMGRKVQLIRSRYDPTTQKNPQQVAHTFPRPVSYWSIDPATYLNADKLADLSESEKKQLVDWLKVKAEKHLAAARLSSVLLAGQTLAELADAIDVDGITAKQSAVVWGGMSKVAKSLRRAGHPKKDILGAQ